VLDKHESESSSLTAGKKPPFCFSFQTMDTSHSKLPRVVIVGGGFGGLEAAKALANERVRVTLIDRANHYLFQPLLYQVATAELSPANIAQPIRFILRNAKNVEVVLAEVTGVDAGGWRVLTAERAYEYDFLIVAAGTRHSYFGHDEWEKFAPGLKRIEDALEIRRRILSAFEVAEKTSDADERHAALTFVVIGAGPTGVEMAGAIAEMSRYALAKDFRHIDPTHAKVILLDAAPRVLPTFHETLSAKARTRLERLGIDVRCGTAVKKLSEKGVEIEGETLRARTIVWAAGNAASPLGKSLGVELDRTGRVIVNEDLTVPGHREIQVIGDMANFSHTDYGKPLPGLSPLAMQQGRHAARNILFMIAGDRPLRFKYFDKGTMATIGRNAAVADMHIARFNGFPAWLAWLFVHLIFLMGFRNRVLVFIQWVWAYVTFSKGARLITETARWED
jgi:NADH:quinone reductase (non-electrogenic)